MPACLWVDQIRQFNLVFAVHSIDGDESIIGGPKNTESTYPRRFVALRLMWTTVVFMFISKQLQFAIFM